MKKKIIVRLMGGLGNQLFQYSYARYLQEVYDADIYLDIDGYKKYKIRNFSINKFKLNDRVYIFDKNTISKFELLKYKITRNLYHIYQFIIKKLTRKNKMGEKLFKYLAKMGYVYNFDIYYYDTPRIKSDIIFVYGYFQSDRYFELVDYKIREELTLKENISSNVTKIIEEIPDNSVAVSIRCGEDYLNSDLNVFSKKFFYDSIEYIKKEISDFNIYVFSDDIKKCKEMFNFEQKVFYVEGLKDYESIEVMKVFNKFIISNSSFSWFGSYLSNEKNKMVIAPKRWYKNPKDKADIYLKNTVKL